MNITFRYQYNYQNTNVVIMANFNEYFFSKLDGTL